MGGPETINGSSIGFILRRIFRVCIEPLKQVFKVLVLLPCDTVGVLRVLRSYTEHVEFVVHLCMDTAMRDHSHMKAHTLP